MSDTAHIVPFPGQAQHAEPALSLSNIGLTHEGVPLLNGVTATVSKSGVTGLLGPNGAGKSLLLRTIMSLIAPTQGNVTIAEDIGAPSLVFQKPVLLRRSVRANLIHALKVAGVSRKDRPGVLAELLVAANLTRLAENPARSLSGGEQQRLAIVRALAASPKLLLLDEPTASLDPTATKAIEDLLKSIAAKGVKVVLVTHDQAQAARLCDDIIFLHKGTVLEHTPAEAFFKAPATDIAKAYLSGDLLL